MDFVKLNISHFNTLKTVLRTFTVNADIFTLSSQRASKLPLVENFIISQYWWTCVAVSCAIQTIWNLFQAELAVASLSVLFWHALAGMWELPQNYCARDSAHCSPAPSGHIKALNIHLCDTVLLIFKWVATEKHDLLVSIQWNIYFFTFWGVDCVETFRRRDASCWYPK